jgi:flagellum-specific peptidoglycan hydrolase FlgJ
MTEALAIDGAKVTPAEFVAAYKGAAAASQAATRVPALVTLGQAALESGWGKSAPRFNFLGIKAKATDPAESRQLLRTREVMKTPDAKFPEVISVTKRPDGKYDYVVRDWFRAYPDAAAAFRAHGQILKNNPRYAKAFAAQDPEDFAGEVAKAGYATDPNYAVTLTKVMKRIAPLIR